MNIKAIPTKYAGITFRSRTEARWAVFFDELGWRWAYEPEGFQLKAGWYLPDFLVHIDSPSEGSGDRWIEVKPFKGPECPVDMRWQDLAKESEIPVMTVYGMHRPGDGCQAAWNQGKAEPHAGRISVQGENPTLLGPFWTELPFADAWNAANNERFGT